MDNYFNYFTEIERYYQSRRESFTLLSTLDWVLIETWKDQGVPLEAVLKGMDRAFSRTKRKISSLAYCANAVSQVVKEQKDMRIGTPDLPEFSADEVQAYLGSLADQVQTLREKFPEFEARFGTIAKSIRDQSGSDLRSGEQALGALEEKLIAIIKIAADEESLIDVKREVERNLTPFRKTMTVEQIAMLDQQLWKRKLMERYGVPRLSLFYLI
jgi:hypothetical protein